LYHFHSCIYTPDPKVFPSHHSSPRSASRVQRRHFRLHRLQLESHASANDAIFNSYSIPTISTAASVQAECICRYPKCKPPRREKMGEGCHAQPCTAQVVLPSRHTITTGRLDCILLQNTWCRASTLLSYFGRMS
jgi:hypothetical protein